MVGTIVSAVVGISNAWELTWLLPMGFEELKAIVEPEESDGSKLLAAWFVAVEVSDTELVC